MKSSCSRLLEKSFAIVCICAFSCMSLPHAYCCWIRCLMYLIVGMYLCIHYRSFMLPLCYSSLFIIVAFSYKWFYVLVWLLHYSFRVNDGRSFCVIIFIDFKSTTLSFRILRCVLQSMLNTTIKRIYSIPTVIK